jgi:hypothetical protein
MHIFCLLAHLGQFHCFELIFRKYCNFKAISKICQSLTLYWMMWTSANHFIKIEDHMVFLSCSAIAEL